MGKLANLLRWKKRVELRNESNKPLLDEDGNPVIVWVRLLGDFDMQEAFKLARIDSAKTRELLRTPDSIEYKDQVQPLIEADVDQCKEIIRAARSANWTAEAYSVVVRPDLPEIEEVAVDPDAPTLEEQEKLDKKTKTLEDKYRKEIDKYIETKSNELEAELKDMELDALRAMAKYEVSNVLPLAAFVSRLNDEKVWRSVYVDSDCKERGFSSLEEFKEASSVVREQLIQAYTALENNTNSDELKN